MTTLTKKQIEMCLRIGSLEWAANKEYGSNRYHPEKGGPALAALNVARKEKREMDERLSWDEVAKRHSALLIEKDVLTHKLAAVEKKLSGALHEKERYRSERDSYRSQLNLVLAGAEALTTQLENERKRVERSWPIPVTELMAERDAIIQLNNKLRSAARKLLKAEIGSHEEIEAAHQLESVLLEGE